MAVRPGIIANIIPPITLIMRLSQAPDFPIKSKSRARGDWHGRHQRRRSGRDDPPDRCVFLYNGDLYALVRDYEHINSSGINFADGAL